MIRLNPKKLEEQDAEALIGSKLDWIVRTLAHCLPSKIYLFGSAVHGRLSETSDLDFALVYSSDEDVALAKSVLYSAPRNDDWPMDFLFYTSDDLMARARVGGVAHIIVNEGRLVFERDSTS